MTAAEELNIARKRLFDSLGEDVTVYYHLLRQWFTLKMSKEEFDLEAKRILNPDQTQLHNEFLLCLFNKCQSLGNDTYKSKNKDLKRAKFNKMKRSVDKGPFQLADPVLYIQPIEAQPSSHLPEEPKYCTQELFLPDRSLIMSRLLLSSWEMGMKGAEDGAAEVLVLAVQIFLKNILTAIFSLRSGYKMHNKKFKFAMNCDVPNPWLRNYQSIVDVTIKSTACSVYDADSNLCYVPRGPITPEELERREAFRTACSTANLKRKPKLPVTTYDVLQALIIHKSTVPCHTLYSLNLERIISSLYHPSHEELEASKLLKQPT